MPLHYLRKQKIRKLCLFHLNDTCFLGDRLKLGMKVGYGPGHIVLDGAQLPSTKGFGAQLPQFSAAICSGQKAGWIKMPLGREIGLSPSDIVLDGDPVRRAPPQFSAHFCGQTAGGQDATWYEGRFRLRPQCVTWGSRSPKIGTAPNFRPMSIVAKRSPISATAC